MAQKQPRKEFRKKTAASTRERQKKVNFHFVMYVGYGINVSGGVGERGENVLCGEEK